MTAFCAAAFRAQFPALASGRIYLDSAATALKPQAMIDALQRYYASETGSLHRGHYSAARQITALFEQSRQAVADWLHAASAQQIIWTHGTTEALNMVARCFLQPHLQAGDEIIVSEAEHHANLIPWQMVAAERGARIVTLPLGTDHRPDLHRLPALLNARTRLLALTQMSNVTGGRPDLRQAIALAHAAGVPVVVDGAQGAAHGPIDLRTLDVDFYAFSAHKCYGPEGVGVLYGRTEHLQRMTPWLGGGKMLRHASMTTFSAADLPWRLEAGTPDTAGILAFTATLAWLRTVDLSAADAHACELAARAERRLRTLPGFRSLRDPHSSLLSFVFDGVHPYDLALLLAERGIELRAGQLCAQPMLQALKCDAGVLRAAFAPYNTQADTDALFEATRYALSLLQE